MNDQPVPLQHLDGRTRTGAHRDQGRPTRSGRDLISSSTRGRFRSLMTGSTDGQIRAAFQDEGFAPNPDSTWDDGSVRRTTTQHHLEAVDWTDHSHVTRALRVIARLIEDFDDQYSEPLRKALRGDGCRIDEHGQITIAAAQLPRVPLDGLRDPAAILDNLDRIQRAIGDDPAQAVGSAKELIESTAKTVMIERGEPVNDKDDIAALIRKAQQALSLHPSAATPGPDGSDAVKRILGSVTGVAIGVAELRNRGYGTGHGAAGARVGLSPRHAHLAVNAAITWCQLMLDTLADTNAPWRTTKASA